MPAPMTPTRDQLFEIGKATLTEQMMTSGNVERKLNSPSQDVEMVVERHTALVTQLQLQREMVDALEAENHKLIVENAQLHDAVGSGGVVDSEGSNNIMHSSDAPNSDESAVIIELKHTLEQVRQNVQAVPPSPSDDCIFMRRIS